MKKKSQAVVKAFTPEETSLIENMVAIGNQLLTMSEGGEVAVGAPVLPDLRMRAISYDVVL